LPVTTSSCSTIKAADLALVDVFRATIQAQSAPPLGDSR
jgi:hypothetical protein